MNVFTFASAGCFVFVRSAEHVTPANSSKETENLEVRTEGRKAREKE